MPQLSEQLCAVKRKFVRQAVLLRGKHTVKQPVSLINLAVQQQSAEQGLCCVPCLPRFIQAVVLYVEGDRLVPCYPRLLRSTHCRG